MSGADRPLLYWSAGEASGDHHAAEVIARIRSLAPDIQHAGLGGQAMAQAGMELKVDLARDFAIIGFTRAIAAYPALRRILRSTVESWKTNRPVALVCVDYPGFNLPLAKEAAKLGIPVLWYISPQVWAWKEGRTRTMASALRRVFVILPFEEEFLRQRGVRADYLGNPLLDELPSHRAPNAEARAALGIPPEATVIGLLPGSRTREIVRHLPLLVEVARTIHAARPEARFILPIAPTVDADDLNTRLLALQAPEILTTTNIRDARLAMDAALCKSGTSTLELAITGVPMVIFYITSWLNAFIARRLLKIRDIGLVNLVAGRRISPEHIQEAATAPLLSAAIMEILPGTSAHSAQLEALSDVRSILGPAGASDRIAEAIVEELRLHGQEVVTDAGL